MQALEQQQSQAAAALAKTQTASLLSADPAASNLPAPTQVYHRAYVILFYRATISSSFELVM
jgi:hypothetical protein